MLWFTRAAGSRHLGASNQLGVMFLNGEGVERDCDRAADLLRYVAEQGPWGQVNMDN